MRKLLLAVALVVGVSGEALAEETSESHLVFMSGQAGLSYVPFETMAACERAKRDIIGALDAWNKTRKQQQRNPIWKALVCTRRR